MTGGLGRDNFVFASLTETGLGINQDQITDFTTGVDTINLRGISTGMVFIGSAAFSGTAGEVRFDTLTKQLQIDVFGTGTPDGTILLTGVTSVANGDLIL